MTIRTNSIFDGIRRSLYKCFRTHSHDAVKYTGRTVFMAIKSGIVKNNKKLQVEFVPIDPKNEGSFYNPPNYSSLLMEPDKYIRANIDLTSMPEFDTTAGVLVPAELAKEVISSHVIEEKYWYCTELGAASYLKLNNARNNYKAFTESKRILRTNIYNIVEMSFNVFKKWRGGDVGKNKNPQIELISLGIGGATKELLILDEFLDEHKIGNSDSDKPMTFIPIDMSYPLLMYGLREIEKKFNKDMLDNFLIIEPYLTDFTKCSASDFGNADYRFITALGVVYNASIPNIFTSLKNLMTNRTLLLIDMETVGNRNDEQICEQYDDEDSKRFFFNTIDLLSSASTQAKTIYKDRRKIGNYKDFNGLIYNADNIQAEIISKNTLGEFRKKYNLPPRAEKIIRISPDSNSKTVALVYKPHSKPAYILGYSTRFDEGEFRHMLDQNGFEIKGEWSGQNTNTMYFLLQLKQGNSTKIDNAEEKKHGKSIGS